MQRKAKLEGFPDIMRRLLALQVEST
jgi:hypothetical protein